MDARRSAKSRSIGTEARTARPAQRPELGERIHSAPTPARRPHSTAKRTSDTLKIAGVIDRSSKASIRDDPFFRSYHSPQSVRLAEQSRTGRAGPPEPEEANGEDGLPQVTLVVLGATGVGKSTFVQNSFDLRSPMTSAYAVQKMSLDTVVYLVRLVEMSLDDVLITESNGITWPTALEGVDLPPVDGVLALYDVTNQDSITGIPELLHALHTSKFPCVLVSCKCDNPPPARQLEPGTLGQLGGPFGSIDTRQTSASKPQSQKQCISILLRSILAQSNDSPKHRASSKPRPRAATTSNKGSVARPKSPPDRSQTHTRARSELPASIARGRTQSGSESAKSSSSRDGRRTSAQTSSASSVGGSGMGMQLGSGPPSRQLQSHLSMSSIEVSNSDTASQSEADESPPQAGQATAHLTSVLRPGTADTTDTADTSDSQAHRTFLNMEEESEDESNDEDTPPPSPDVGKLRLTHTSGPDAGSTFDSLVDRLLALPTNKQEANFLPVFLCLYRKFATPRKLLASITERFDALESSKIAPTPSNERLRSGREFAKGGEQLRYLQVLAKWTAEYPGDFADARMKAQVTAFVTELGGSRTFTGAAKEIGNHLAIAVEDDDAAWAYRDGDGGGNGGDDDDDNDDDDPRSSRAEPVAPRPNGPMYSAFDDASVDDFVVDSNHSSLDNLAHSSPRYSGAPSNASSTTKTGNTSNQSLVATTPVEDMRREARALVPVPRLRLSKIQWHQFMDTPDEDFAKELTRIDWTMYSAIRPRDFVRHVSVKDTHHAAPKTLEDVNRMINHFNHLSVFVEGMILLRDKPKHRAKALEKFMAIAWKLRQQNNYNSLASVLSAVNGTAVYRLALTKALVPESVLKEFMRLIILMSTQRSHAAYRLAWENSFSERIPYLALLRRDLMAAEDGNMTFVGPDGSLINWKKFEIMGQIIVGIQKSQDRPFYFPVKNEEVMKLVLETRILEGDMDSLDPRNELYDRSVQLEPSGVGGEASRKKFDWFRR